MAHAIWEFLFKYPLLVFEKGRLVFSSPLPLWLLVLAFAAAGFAGWNYLRRTSKLGKRDRAGLLILRGALLTVLLLILLGPALQVAVAIEQENYVGILIDDSRSMLVADDGTTTRAQALIEQLDEELLAKLSENFRVRLFSFSGEAKRIENVGELTFQGGKTNIGAALDGARSDMAGNPLASLVVVSDGADHAEAELNSALLSLRTAGIPVSTVGVGREQFEKDIEIRRISTPRSVLRGTSMVVDVTIAQSGYAGRTLPLIVEDEGQVVNSQDVRMPDDGTPTSVQIHFTADQSGWRRFKFRVPLQDGELVIQNNQRESLVEVRAGPQKILYFEGEPRFEVKFMRRAVGDDPELQLVLLQRTAENKFLRLDVDNGEELVDGFPTTREELFAYRAIVLGSVEASYFSRDQLRMIVDFVSERGGSILFLGGRRAYNEGGYAGTPIADLMPVQLDGSADPAYYRELKVVPTQAGLAHAALRLDNDPAVSGERWSTLPELSTFNRVTRLKPGATALLVGQGAGVAEGQVVLASQRFGRGLSLALPIQDTWMWQMDAEIPLEDQTHETLWKQLLRWLVNGVPDPLTVTASAEPAALNQTLQLQADLRDKTYTRVGDASVSATVESPTGVISGIPMRWTSVRDGEYVASFVPQEPGLHRVDFVAERGGEILARTSLSVDAVVDEGEFFNAQMRGPLLRRMAEETGGGHYALNEMDRLANDIQFSGSGITRVESYDLWDMPILFLLIIGLVGGEWAFRRTRGLP